MTARNRLIAASLLLFCSFGLHAQGTATQLAAPVQYKISLADVPSHRLHLQVYVPRAAGEVMRLPVWNALYQVRDFAQYVTNVTTTDSKGRPLVVSQRDKSSWSVAAIGDSFLVDYDITVATAGPYGADSSAHHVFLNLAEVLMYVAGTEHARPVTLQFSNLPQGWKVATTLRKSDKGGRGWVAPSYDALVDAPVEIGNFREITFQDGSTSYRVVIDAETTAYNATAVENSTRRIVHTEAEWMNDQPCSEYLFIYHFPHGFGGGGMEHACSTAIDVPAERMADGMSAFESVTAHEFFHQWNVKRIRPQSLEPIDYTKEQYTRALWFSEGVTSTVEDYILLRAGLLKTDEYFRRLSVEIDTLQQRPARKTQSAEESSLNAWLEKYPFYRRPERSVSYYNKGEIVGVMLDLAMRDATGGAKSIRDAFLWMNGNYAKEGRFFADSAGVRTAVEAVTGKDFSTFFQKYVAGTSEIPYDSFLNTVGLRVIEEHATVADAGFLISKNFDGMPIVISVQSGSDAERAGLREGDEVVGINDESSAVVDDQLSGLSPGETVRLRVRWQSAEREIRFKAASREVSRFKIADVDHPTKAQLSLRAGWLGLAARTSVNMPTSVGESLR